MPDQIFIQHRFTIEKNGKKYTDALVMLKDEYDKLKPKDIEDKKNKRFDDWEQVINNPPPPIELTEEEQLVQINKDLLEVEQLNQTLLAKKEELEGGK